MNEIALAAWPTAQSMDGEAVAYGPLGPDEAGARLLGPLDAKRVLVLGAAGATVVALAKAGARLTVAEPDEDVIRASQQACEANGVTAEHLHGSLGELAAVRADSIDLAVGIYSLNGTAELSRVLRQVHRVLRPDQPLVASLPHPALDMLDDAEQPGLANSYGDDRPRSWEHDTVTGSHHSRSLEQLFTELSRASLRVDTVLESTADRIPDGSNRSFWRPAMASVPNTLVLRARKLGV